MLLTKRIRKEDAKAYKMLKSRMTVVTLSASEKSRWKSVFKTVRDRLASDGTLKRDWVKKVEALADRHR